ncbi:unnamed protein product, partial [Ilex paraguariensis]
IKADDRNRLLTVHRLEKILSLKKLIKTLIDDKLINKCAKKEKKKKKELEKEKEDSDPDSDSSELD